DNVLYVIDASGQNRWLISASTAYTPHKGGVLHPHFSHHGDKLIWAQEVGANNWEIQVAAVNSPSSVTLLQTLAPGSQCSGPFYETHGFSLDDSTIFFSGNPQTGCLRVLGYDIYSYNLNTSTLTNLTNSPS